MIIVIIIMIIIMITIIILIIITRIMGTKLSLIATDSPVNEAALVIGSGFCI